MLREAGYDFLQIVPTRGLGGAIKEVATILPVEYTQQPWDPARNFWEGLRGGLVNTSDKPDLLNFAIFSTEKERGQVWESLFREDAQHPLMIVDNFAMDPTYQNSLIEIHVGLGLTPSQIVENLKRMPLELPAVVDLGHLRHPATEKYRRHWPRDVQKAYNKAEMGPIGDWPTSLRATLPFARAIQVQNVPGELEACLAGQSTVLEEMLALIREASFSGDYIVEVRLKPRKALMSKGYVRNTLTDVCTWLKTQV